MMGFACPITKTSLPIHGTLHTNTPVVPGAPISNCGSLINIYSICSSVCGVLVVCVGSITASPGTSVIDQLIRIILTPLLWLLTWVIPVFARPCRCFVALRIGSVMVPVKAK